MDEQLLDRVRVALRDEAARVDLGDAALGLARAHRVARRRHRRNVASIAVLCTVALVGGIAIVSAVTGNEPDSIIIDTPPTTLPDPDAPPDDGTTPDAVAPELDGGSTETEPPVPVAALPIPVEEPAAGAPVVGVARAGSPTPVAGLATEFPGSFESIHAWQDGFLIARVEISQASPPPLSDELNSRFPPEVLDLFPDGLPSTLGEAGAVLSEAGLLDEALAVIEADPEIQAALYSEPVTSTLMLDFSTDGETWTALDVVVPAAVTTIDRVTVVGDRLVTVGSAGRTAFDEVPDVVTVASTTDLVDWRVETVPIDAVPDLPDTVWVMFDDGEFVANDAGWLYRYSIHADIDVQQFVPESLGDENGGHSTEWMDDGFEATFYDRFGAPIDTVEITFAELGLDADHAAFLQNQGDVGAAWTAAWGDEPALVEGMEPWNEIVVLADGFIEFVHDDTGARRARFTRDFRTWTSVDALPTNEWVTGTMHLDRATIVVTQDRIEESHAYRVSSDGQVWAPIDVDGLPLGRADIVDMRTAGSALLVDATPPPEREAQGAIEHDGRRLVLVDTRTTRSYELSDVATGDVLAAELVHVIDVSDSGQPFTHLEQDEDGVTVVDPESRAVLASFPLETWWEVRGDMEHEIYVSRPDFGEDDLWLIATTDGVDWLVDDIPERDPRTSDTWFPSVVGSNGDTVLVGGPDGWLRYDLDG